MGAPFQTIAVEELAGLRPKAWVCVGAGFSREDIKADLLSKGLGLVGEAITSLEEIARKIVSSSELAGSGAGVSKESVLGPSARQEILRAILSDRQVAAAAGGFPELKKLKRQSAFFKKLDLAIQAGRLAFAHSEEEQVYLERLRQKLGGSADRPVRTEVRMLAAAYEGWLRAYRLWDHPLLFSEATRVLNDAGWPSSLARPETLYVLSNQLAESRERDFCDALQSHLNLQKMGYGEAQPIAAASAERFSLERWHSWDDAAEGLVDALLGEVGSDGSFCGHVILISDQPQIRRSLNRVLSERRVAQADPRDPTRLRWDECIKWALLPLQVLGRDFERAQVIAWLRAFQSGRADLLTWVSEINSRGVRQGLSSYSGGTLTQLHAILSELSRELSGRKTCAEIAQAHLSVLGRGIATDSERAWLFTFFEQVWRAFAADLALLDRSEKRAPLRYWLERLQARVQETPSPVLPLKASDGIAVYRLQTAPVIPPARVWVFGLPPDWLSGEANGDYWFSAREREVLGAEFSVRSGIQVRSERLSALATWVQEAGKITIFDSLYDPDGRERETLTSLLREVSPELAEIKTKEQGAHFRWQASYGALRSAPPQEIRLSPMPLRPGAEKPEISATALDHYSRCAFQGLAYDRWKLRDARDPDTELWPEVRGNILHQAVKHLLESRDEEGKFTLDVSQALDRAWKEIPPKGLLKGSRVESYVKSRLSKVLRVFCEKENEYFARAGAQTISLDEMRLSLDYPDFRVVGKPDRIDRSRENEANELFIIDYKTSSALPSGSDMLQLGYRLQLPFYALAAQRQLRAEVAGVQFVELTSKGGRGNGMFFKKFNGKEPGKFTSVTARSKSLLSVEPQDAWARMDEQIAEHARAMIAGRFAAAPKKEDKECATCRLQDLCGKRRVVDVAEESELS